MRATMGRWLFLGKVWLLVAAIRVGLWVLPFATVRRLVRRWGRRTPRLECRGTRRVQTLAGAVRDAARFVPGASCLTRALAMEVLLSRAGHMPRLGLGFRRDAGGAPRAHAWVTSEDEVVIGGGQLDLFVALPPLEEGLE